MTSEQQIEELVNRFYGKVRNDGLLGPIFANAISDDWEPHLAKMRAFWSTVMLASRTYKGNPMMAHLGLPRLERQHFERWLALWRETTAEVCGERAAAEFIDKAEMIGERFLYAITAYHGAQHSTAQPERASAL